MAALQSSLPATGGAATSSFSAGGGSVFIPKKKQAAAGGGDFPALGQTGAPAAKEAPKKEPEDPCYGKPKEFFIYDFNQQTNTCFCLPEQLTFVATYYTDHYFAPIDILMWLYDMAEYRDAVKEQKELDEKKAKQAAALGAAKSGPTVTAAASKGKVAKKEVTYELSDEEEESTFGNNYKQLAKKKSAPAPSKPVFGGKQLTEA